MQILAFFSYQRVGIPNAKFRVGGLSQCEDPTQVFSPLNLTNIPVQSNSLWESNPRPLSLGPRAHLTTRPLPRLISAVAPGLVGFSGSQGTQGLLVLSYRVSVSLTTPPLPTLLTPTGIDNCTCRYPQATLKKMLFPVQQPGNFFFNFRKKNSQKFQ